jgi:hypothetical protein
MVETQTREWYESLADSEREECVADLTDAYLAALNADAWQEFKASVRQWQDRAELKQLIAV